uniref:Uncharacterized protein n=1 Tax=Oscillatoriales cyanobacterium SpSt-402 TaxID=2282168 RepID=A0A832H4S3_9CYAN
MGLLFLILQVPVLYAFDAHDFNSWEFTPTNPLVETAKRAVRFLLPRIVGDDNQVAIKLGFSGIEDLASLKLGKLDVNSPFPVFRIQLDRLRKWQMQSPKPNPIGLLLEEPNFLRWSIPSPARFLFPITNKGQVKSSVLIAMSSNDQFWKIRQFGSSSKIKQLIKHGHPPKYFVVEIPGLERCYLGSITGNTFRIKHVVDEWVATSHGEQSTIKILEGTEELAVGTFNRLKTETEETYYDKAPR